MRFEKEINIYGDDTVLKRFQANETSISVLQGKISALISESELVELENSQATMYSKLASAILDIESLTLNFSDLTTKYNTVSGQYTSLDSEVAQYKASVNGLSATITSVQQNLFRNYSTTSQMNAAITARANEIRAEISAVRTTLQNDYSTIASMNSAINQKANEITATVSSTYATKSSVTSANSRIATLEDWKNEASLKITDSAIVSTVIASTSYENSVNSMIEQKADSIRLKATQISWESRYSSMTALGELTCENANINGVFRSTGTDGEVTLNEGLMRFTHNNSWVGYIGEGDYSGGGHGLIVSLIAGSYITMAQDGSMRWTYAKDAIGSYDANTLNAGCDIDMHNHRLKKVAINDIVSIQGYAPLDGSYNVITQITDNGNGTISWRYGTVRICDGLITSWPT